MVVIKTINKYLITIVIFLIFLPCTIVRAQNVFFGPVSNGVDQITVPPYTASQIITWSNTQANSIPIYFQNWTSATISPSCDTGTSRSQFIDAWGQWKSASSSTFNFWQTTTSTTGVNVFFSNVYTDFPDPDNDPSVSNYTFKTSSASSGWQIFATSASNVIFNWSDDFLANYSITNLTANLLPNTMCFEQAALHELGHIIGIGDFPTTLDAMSGKLYYGHDLYPLQTNDKTALSTLVTRTQILTPVCNGTCPLPSPTGFSINFVGGYPVLSWDQYTAAFIEGLQIYKNGFYIDLSTSATSYTDYNWNSSVPNSYYVYVWAFNPTYVAGQSYTINVSASPSTPISSNTTFSGVVYFNSNVTINSGVTLTIQSGTNLFIPNGDLLTVNGTLNSIGNSSDPITFNFGSPNSSTQNGIIFNSGSSGTISYCKILNAYSGIYENSTSVNVSNAAISNCLYGIYLYNSNPIIGSCNIHDNSNYGICLISSSPYLYDNYIQNNSTGINCQSSSSPYFGNGNTQGNNNITGNSDGVFCENNSYPMLGNSSPVNGGYNNLVNTSSNVYCMSSSGIYAENNWWGTTNQSNFKIEGEGNVVDYPYLTSNVNIANPPLSKAAVNLYTSQGNNVPLLSELNQVNQLIAENNLEQARAICINMVTNYPDSSLSYNALNLLKGIYPVMQIDSVKNIYQSLFNNKQKKDLYAMASLILADVDTVNKLSHINDVINSYGKDTVVEYALFDKFVYYHFEKGDKQNADAVLNQLDKMFPYGSEDIQAHIIQGDTSYYHIILAKKPALQETTVQTPAEYTLFDNYPNPFNPSTIISYQLPKDGVVTVKVFDILGREVNTLVNGYKTAGSYSVSFDASKLASGIYFYQLRSGNFISTKKMLLLK